MPLKGLNEPRVRTLSCTLQLSCAPLSVHVYPCCLIQHLITDVCLVLSLTVPRVFGDAFGMRSIILIESMTECGENKDVPNHKPVEQLGIETVRAQIAFQVV
jgi:hypothetical protein